MISRPGYPLPARPMSAGAGWKTPRVLISNHVLAGANLGLRASSVTGAFAAGLASHVAMDVTPHYLLRRERMASIAVVDGLSGLSIVGAVLAAAPRAPAPSARTHASR